MIRAFLCNPLPHGLGLCVPVSVFIQLFHGVLWVLVALNEMENYIGSRVCETVLWCSMPHQKQNSKKGIELDLPAITPHL